MSVETDNVEKKRESDTIVEAETKLVFRLEPAAVETTIVLP
jgi:hypothetical protein